MYQKSLGLKKCGVLTLIQNPALDISSYDELTVSMEAPKTSKFDKNFYLSKKPKKCNGGLRCIFRKLFCFHSNLLHSDSFGLNSYKANQKLTKKNENINDFETKGTSGSKKKIAEKRAKNLFQQEHHQQMLKNKTINSTHIP